MSEPMISNERLLLLITDERRARETLQTRVDVLEHFIKREFPEYFAGEAETIVDPTLNPIPITFTAPQESDPTQWKERDNAGNDEQ